VSLLPNPPVTPLVVWTIAGSDPCGGAGIQADLKTFAALGVHGCSAITSLTAQNSFAVRATESVSPAMLEAQLAALLEDLPPRAIKIGMLGDIEGIKIIGKYIEKSNTYTVFDPVMIASTGTSLIGADIIPAMKQFLFPHVDLLTPNIAEAETLLGKKISDDMDIEQAATAILKFGVKAVIIKGSVRDGFAQDFYCSKDQSFWITSPARTGKDSRGTGCTFASALAATHALGFSKSDAAVIAKAYVNQARRLAHALGKGMDFLTHERWPCAPDDLPWITKTADEGRIRPSFPNCGNEPLGFYPIVDSTAWLERLLPLGVTTAQLRIKNLSGEKLEDEIRRAVTLARKYNCRLFINDYWELAIEHKAYGVHLGQEDLATTDIPALEKSGLRLGISTHSYAELARAHALQPSTIALGPIFPTTLKTMSFAPQGVGNLRIWRHILDYPLVAIGGITLEYAAMLAEAGADGIAVVSDVTKNADPEKRVKEWLEFFNSRRNAKNSCSETAPQRRSA